VLRIVVLTGIGSVEIKEEKNTADKVKVML
jgi:hypothetical protein